MVFRIFGLFLAGPQVRVYCSPRLNQLCREWRGATTLYPLPWG